ncbi:class I SAM-dependent methyltransferase [Rhizobium rhizogenes]|uniref:Polysaccharide deacetylase/methyltransferase protein n=1 Tax=Rhizobium rhizogenes (strain K84 / ATCC BAA-868) TaxID=311403 RepID=B9JP08_RHIR8|nr:polysaccharide deacetylase/methyltransferase protein [Rhizobium rhizogenes K84]
MSHVSLVQKTFDNWAIKKNGALKMSTEHWPRIEGILTNIENSAGNYLEIGPGNGYSIKYMAENKFSAGQCYGIDLSQEMINCCIPRTRDLKNVYLETADFCDWEPPKNTYFDLIFSMEVFYYFKNMGEAINKAASLLSDGGELVVMVDFFLENPVSHSWPEQMGLSLALWSKDQYADSFIKSGLSEVSQVLISGGQLEDGLTLCTRGRRLLR